MSKIESLIDDDIKENIDNSAISVKFAMMSKQLEEKDKEIERLNKRIEDLNTINEEHKILNGMIRKELQQKENIIKEAKKYIKEHSTTINFETMRADYNLNMNELLEILEKVEE